MKQDSLKIGFFSLFLSVLLGAFGAHSLEKILDPRALETFQVGVHYLTTHSLVLLIHGILHRSSWIKRPKLFKWSTRILLIGVFIFSGCCMLYALTKLKFVALITPIGGLSLMVSHLLAFASLGPQVKDQDESHE